MNRGRLFATIEHVEHVHAHALERPKRPSPAPGRPSAPPGLTPRARAEQLFRPVLTATPAALATAAKRARRTQPSTVVLPPARDPKGAVKLTAKALKVMLVLDPVVFGKIELLRGASAPPFVIDVGDRKVRAQISAKSLRKALALIAEHGADKVAVIVQGKLETGDVIAEAGLVAQVKSLPLARTGGRNPGMSKIHAKFPSNSQ